MNIDVSLLASLSCRNGPWQRRRYWLPESFGVPHVSQLVTDEQSHARWSRNEAKQARKNARRLALRDAATKRGAAL